MSEAPALSVVVGLISGRKSDLARCLAALRGQREPLPVEVIVPYDDPCADVATLAPEFPQVKFLRATALDTWKARAGASREHHDALRTLGLRAASADVVALTEDHAHAAPDWCAEMAHALERHPEAGAVGGAVECDSERRLNWAVWFCDFGRYQNPLPEGRAAFVSDSNVAYRRRALDKVEPVWRDRYHETTVHAAMVEAGFVLCTTPRAVVQQARGDLALGAALRERFVWGRSFAGTRARLVGSPRRWILAVLTPLLPVVMTWRVTRTALDRRRHRRRLVEVLPLILLLHAVWALGEFVGYVTADPG